MSGIAAIIRFDGGTVEPGQIEKMTAAMHYRGVDGIAHWTDGQAALGHCMLRTTAESLEEVQPLTNEDESLVLVMDGWLSNWEELRGDLLARGARLRTRSDAELVLRAYETWGEDCPKHIDGEFAFLVWDKRRGEAYLANDHIGLKMLHYHWDGQRLIVASDILGVFAGPGVPREPNLGKIAEFLAHSWHVRDETIWRDVMRAHPARWMRFGLGGAQSQTYWEPPFEVIIRYRRDQDYFDHYRALFDDCVRRTSRSHLPIACDVSGGLDSSAVFAMAHDLLRRGGLQAPDVKGYTYLFDETARPDIVEIDFARAVAKHVGAGVREIAPFLPNADWFVRRSHDDCNIAGYPNGAMSTAIGQALVEDGCRVILNGEGGDEWAGGSRFYYNEQIRSGDWKSMLGSLREDAANAGLRVTVRDFLRSGLAPCFPTWVQNIGRLLQDVSSANDFATAYWLKPDVSRLLFKRRADTGRRRMPAIEDPLRERLYGVMTDPFAIVVWDQFSRHSARLGYEIRTPLYARQYIEFAFATPETTRLRGGVRKFTHIGALRDLLPDVVAERRTKANFAFPFERLLTIPDGQMQAVLQGHGSEFVDGGGSSVLYRRCRDSGWDGVRMWALWSVFLIESVFGKARAGREGDLNVEEFQQN